MSGITPDERERIALMLSDALMPYGRNFDAVDAARLIEARITEMLNRARAEAWDAGMLAHSNGAGSDANPWKDWAPGATPQDPELWAQWESFTTPNDHRMSPRRITTDGRWQRWCSCGWQGPICDTASEARQSHGVHLINLDIFPNKAQA